MKREQLFEAMLALLPKAKRPEFIKLHNSIIAEEFTVGTELSDTKSIDVFNIAVNNLALKLAHRWGVELDPNTEPYIFMFNKLEISIYNIHYCYKNNITLKEYTEWYDHDYIASISDISQIKMQNFLRFKKMVKKTNDIS